MVWKKKKTRRKNPYDDEQSNLHGLQSEERVVTDMGGKLQIGSGAITGLKSDGIKEAGDYTFRIECKATIKQSLSIKHEWLRKIRDEAMQTNMIPALTISFVEGDGKPKVAGDWVLLPAYVIQELFEGLEGGNSKD